MAGKALDKIRYLINIATEDRETGVMQTLVTVHSLEEIAKEVEDLEERISIMEDGNNLGGALKFRDKQMFFGQRLSGKTAIDMQIMMEHIKNGDPIVYVSKDKTTEFKPVRCCKDCNEPRMKIIRDAKTGERKEVLYCSWNGHHVTDDDYCSGFKPKDGDPDA